jgi:hypothetical protein
MADALRKQPNSKILKAARFDVSGHDAGLFLVARQMPVGLVGVFTLYVSGGGKGYDLTCGGEANAMDEIGEACEEVMSSFELR